MMTQTQPSFWRRSLQVQGRKKALCCGDPTMGCSSACASLGRVACCRLMPVVILFLAVILGWLSSKEQREAVMIATISPLMKSKLLNPWLLWKYI